MKDYKILRYIIQGTHEITYFINKPGDDNF